jgi:hypothetical protein
MRTHDETLPTRRTFLQQSLAISSTLAGVGAMPGFAATEAKVKRCLVVMMIGGPSQIDTFDPKPDAPVDVRGPFRPIRTSVPGLHLSECFPHLAARARHLCLIRSLHHDSAPIHETGLQLMQTGQLATDEMEFPHFLATVSEAKRQPLLLRGGTLEHTGLTLSRGQGVGFLSSSPIQYDPREGFGIENASEIADSLERIPFQLINCYSSLFGKTTWDCHADRGSLATTVEQYRTEVAPPFDAGLAAIMDRLEARGMLDETLIVAMGEMGRSPVMNGRGGRDHWTRAWSILLAGGGLPGGSVIGATDRLGGEPTINPVHPTQLVATLYRLLGVNLSTDARFEAISRNQSIPF